MNTQTANPRNAQEAARIIVLNERARQIIAEGYTFSADAELGITYVCKPGRLYAEYWISGGRCDCPARQKERTCKHEIAAALVKEEAAMWEAICAQYDLEYVTACI